MFDVVFVVDTSESMEEGKRLSTAKGDIAGFIGDIDKAILGQKIHADLGSYSTKASKRVNIDKLLINGAD